MRLAIEIFTVLLFIAMAYAYGRRDEVLLELEITKKSGYIMSELYLACKRISMKRDQVRRSLGNTCTASASLIEAELDRIDELLEIADQKYAEETAAKKADQ